MPRSKYLRSISRYGRISLSLMKRQMMRVISSPSISTMGFLTLIFGAMAACCSTLRRSAAGGLYTPRMTLYDQLTDGRTRFVRIDELCRRGGELRPDLLPSADELAAEDSRMLRDKLGAERRTAAFVAGVLGDAEAGAHLCHAMLLPHPGTAARLAEYAASGALELPGATVHR